MISLQIEKTNNLLEKFGEYIEFFNLNDGRDQKEFLEKFEKLKTEKPINYIQCAEGLCSEYTRCTHTEFIVEYLYRDQLEPLVNENRVRDSSVVRSYYKAMNYIEKCLAQDLPFSEKLIKKTHDLVEGANLPYRDGQNTIYDNTSGKQVAFVWLMRFWRRHVVSM